MKIRLPGIVLFICSTVCLAQSTQPANSKFMRFVEDGRGGGRLQASVVHYQNAAGVTVDLVAAVHIADAAFFRSLDDSFAQYDSVLYELVKPRDSTFGTTQPTTVVATQPTPTMRRATATRSLAWVGSLQRFMRDNLKLTFQLEEIDYSRANFVHADLDAETFAELQTEKGESLLSLMLSEMMRQMSGDAPAGPQIGVMDLIFALQSPDRARSLKLLLARQFGQLDDLAAGFGDPDSTVIIGERNRAALRVLGQRIAVGDKKIAIFYGAAHLKSMEKTLTGPMHFTQIGEPTWRTAWDVDTPAAPSAPR